MKITVMGATGQSGKKVVALLNDAGHPLDGAVTTFSTSAVDSGQGDPRSILEMQYIEYMRCTDAAVG